METLAFFWWLRESSSERECEFFDFDFFFLGI